MQEIMPTGLEILNELYCPSIPILNKCYFCQKKTPFSTCNVSSRKNDPFGMK
jgi:hypothetical protein